MRREYLWALITLIIAIVLAMVLMLVTRDDRGEGRQQLYSDVPLDAVLLPLERRSLDEAYHQHMLLLIKTWLADQAGNPTRFNNGLKIARRAYHQMLEKIEERERQLKQ